MGFGQVLSNSGQEFGFSVAKGFFRTYRAIKRIEMGESQELKNKFSNSINFVSFY